MNKNSKIEIKNMLKKFFSSKLDIINYINNGRLIAVDIFIISKYITDGTIKKITYFNTEKKKRKRIIKNLYNVIDNVINIQVIRSKIIYNIEEYEQHKYNYNSAEKRIFLLLIKPSKNFIKFKYLLCIISIFSQKCNFYDIPFFNYIISFL